MPAQGLIDTGKQKLPLESRTTVQFHDLGSTEDLILEENRNVESGRVSWKKRIMATGVVIFMTAIFAGMLFLAWPRKPEISLKSFEFDEATPSEPDANGQLLSNWIAKVSVKSQNFFDVGVRQIDVKAFIPTNEQTPVGYGTVKDVVIKSQAETIITINFKVPVYQPSSGNPSLIEECMNNGKATLLIKTEVDLNMLHWTGYLIKNAMKENIDCSLPQLFSLVRGSGIVEKQLRGNQAVKKQLLNNKELRKHLKNNPGLQKQLERYIKQ